MFTKVVARSTTTTTTITTATPSSSSSKLTRIISTVLPPHTLRPTFRIIDRTNTTIITQTDRLQHKSHYKRKRNTDHVIVRQQQLLLLPVPVWLLLSPQLRYFTTCSRIGPTPTPITPNSTPPPPPSLEKNKNRKKQNRKRKLLGSPSHNSISAMTTKDRIRLLFETNQTIPKNRFDQSMLSVAPAKDLLDLAQSRLSYVRNSIYQYWNPDYNISNNHNHNNNNATTNTTTNGSTSSSQPQVRTYKAGLVIMDTRWWIWNTLFALLPAILITIYCELRGKRLMYEYHHGLEVEQVRQILGDEEFTIERANAIIAARNKELDEKESTLWSGDLDEIVWKMIKNVIWNVYETSTTIWMQLYDEYMMKNKNQDDNHHQDDDRDTNQLHESTVSNFNDNINTKTNMSTGKYMTAQSSTHQSIPLIPEEQSRKGTSPLYVSSISNISDTDRDEKQQPQDTNVLQSSNELIPKSTSDAVVNPSIEYLLHRIHQMEERLHQLQQPQEQMSPSVLNDKKDMMDQKMVDDKNDAEAIRIIGQRMKHMNQSNVQNRLEIDSKQKWNKYVIEILEKEVSNTPNDNDKVHTESFNGNRSIASDIEFNPNHRNSNDTLTQSSSTAVSTKSNDTVSSMTNDHHQESLFSRFNNIQKLFQEVHQIIGWLNNGSNNETNESDSMVPQSEVAGSNNDNVSTPNPNIKDVNDSDSLPCSTSAHDSSEVEPNTNTRRQPWWKLF